MVAATIIFTKDLTGNWKLTVYIYYLPSSPHFFEMYLFSIDYESTSAYLNQNGGKYIWLHSSNKHLLSDNHVSGITLTFNKYEKAVSVAKGLKKAIQTLKQVYTR